MEHLMVGGALEGVSIIPTSDELVSKCVSDKVRVVILPPRYIVG